MFYLLIILAKTYYLQRLQRLTTNDYFLNNSICDFQRYKNYNDRSIIRELK